MQNAKNIRFSIFETILLYLLDFFNTFQCSLKALMTWVCLDDSVRTVTRLNTPGLPRAWHILLKFIIEHSLLEIEYIAFIARLQAHIK